MLFNIEQLVGKLIKKIYSPKMKYHCSAVSLFLQAKTNVNFARVTNPWPICVPLASSSVRSVILASPLRVMRINAALNMMPIPCSIIMVIETDVNV